MWMIPCFFPFSHHLFFHFPYVWFYKKCTCRTHSCCVANSKRKHQIHDLYHRNDRYCRYISRSFGILYTNRYDSYSWSVSSYSSKYSLCIMRRSRYKSWFEATWRFCQCKKSSKWIDYYSYRLSINWNDSNWNWQIIIFLFSNIFFLYLCLIFPKKNKVNGT